LVTAFVVKVDLSDDFGGSFFMTGLAGTAKAREPGGRSTPKRGHYTKVL